MVSGYDDVLLRKINLVAWDSAAARQADRDFGLSQIPWIRVYDKKGQFIATVSDENPATIECAIIAARAQ